MNNIYNINNISNISNINNISDIDDFSNINELKELNIFNYNKIKKMKRKNYENKYENILDYLLNKSIPSISNRILKEKITDENFFFPDTTNYNLLLNYDFKLNSLKNIAKHHNLKVGGNKEMLLLRIYNYLHLLHHIYKLQNAVRKYFIKKYIDFQGPARIKRNLCVNARDFCTMINISDIYPDQFISFLLDGHVYGFDIMSIYNLFSQSNNVENPFTKIEFSPEILKITLNFINYSKLLNKKINLNYVDYMGSDENEKLNLKAIYLFHKINMLGNYANSCWFTSLSRENLILFVKELIDIWNYRANLDFTVKRDICPPGGNPFKNIINSNINQFEYLNIKKIAIISIENILLNGVDIESKKLGAFYILCGITLVNIDAANALPWLYQSVMHN